MMALAAIQATCFAGPDSDLDTQIVVAAVGEQDFAGHSGTEIGSQIYGALAHVFGRCVSAGHVPRYG